VSETVDSRPFSVFVPSAYSADGGLPLVMFLHHPGGTGSDGEATFGLQTLAEERGYLCVAPEGTSSGPGQFWNATNACWAPPGYSQNDSGYLADVIATIQSAWRVDPHRIFVLGHSNGGFMSHRMACDHAGLLAAVTSIS
jgi:polyhydroxybutyrate depolymerase